MDLSYIANDGSQITNCQLPSQTKFDSTYTLNQADNISQHFHCNSSKMDQKYVLTPITQPRR